MDIARQVITRVLNPRLLNQTASYDVASTIHQSLPHGRQQRESAGGEPHHQQRRDALRQGSHSSTSRLNLNNFYAEIQSIQ